MGDWSARYTSPGRNKGVIKHGVTAHLGTSPTPSIYRCQHGLELPSFGVCKPNTTTFTPSSSLNHHRIVTIDNYRTRRGATSSSPSICLILGPHPSVPNDSYELPITTSCSISFTRGTRVSCKPQNAATFSIWFQQMDVSHVQVSQNRQRIKVVEEEKKKKKHPLTHCCTLSTSSKLTPIRLVPRKCHPVSRGRFCIMIPLSTTSSVSTPSSRLWSDK